MPLTDEQLARWSRYGMEPFNWISEGKLMASVYPGDIDYIRYLRENEGIRRSINLSEAPWPEDWQRDSGVVSYHFPVEDMTVPEESDVREIIRIIDSGDGPVMVHCAAGIGRTGTLMALYLVQHGMEPTEAISHVRKRRRGSIQTRSQEMMIYQWAGRRI